MEIQIPEQMNPQYSPHSKLTIIFKVSIVNPNFKGNLSFQDYKRD